MIQEKDRYLKSNRRLKELGSLCNLKDSDDEQSFVTNSLCFRAMLSCCGKRDSQGSERPRILLGGSQGLPAYPPVLTPMTVVNGN